MSFNYISAGRYCLALILVLSTHFLAAGVPTAGTARTSPAISGKTRVSEYVANNAGCGAYNILRIRALLSGSGSITLSGSATSGRDYTLLNPENDLNNDEKGFHDFLFHVFDDAVLEGDETIILSFPDGSEHTITIADNETSVIVGDGRPVLSSAWPFFRLSTPITTASVVVEASLGPLETVYFMARDGNGVMGKITNLSRHDFGCVTVENLTVDAAADNPPFAGCLPRVFSVTPSNPNSRADYQVTWYLTDEELSVYTSTTTPVEREISIFRETAPGSDKAISSRTADVAWVTGGKALTANFRGGFGKFSVGFKTVHASLYGFNQQEYRGSQLRPVSPAQHKLRNSSQKLASSKVAGQ